MVNIKKQNKLAIFGGVPSLKQPPPAYNSLSKEEYSAAMKVMKQGQSNGDALSGFLGRGGPRFFGGTYVQEFERAACRYWEIPYAVSFNSATTALHAAVSALGIGPGDEVITSPFTMSATGTAILMNNAVPVFADIDPKTYCISAETIVTKITKRTKAILAVNLLGGTPDYGPILALAKKHKLFLIEDSAQAPGAKYRGKYAGTIGDIGIFSFNVHKTIQVGEGGMLVTKNRALAWRAALARNHGEAVMGDLWEKEPKMRELIVGSNYRLTELQAVIMVEQLKKLNKLNSARQTLATDLTKGLKQFPWLEAVFVLPQSTHVYYLYPMKFFQEKIGFSRELFAKAMLAEGFPLNEGYNLPLYRLPIYAHKRIYKHSQFPFVSHEYPHAVSYVPKDHPVTERMYLKEMLTTTLCQPPKNRTHIKKFLEVLKKIEKHRSELITYDKSKKARA